MSLGDSRLRALANVVSAAREVDALVGGSPGRWTLDGCKLTDRAGEALISLTDYLNTVSALEEMPDDLVEILSDPSVIVPQDAAVFELIAEWMKAPSNTASAG